MSQSLSVIFKTLPRHFPSRFQPRLSSSFQSRVYTWEGNRIRFSYRYRVHFLAQHMWNRCILWQPLFVFKSFVCQLKREEGHWGRLDSRTFHIQFSEVFNFLAFQAEALPSPRSYANGANLGGVFRLTGFNVNISHVGSYQIQELMMWGNILKRRLWWLGTLWRSGGSKRAIFLLKGRFSTHHYVTAALARYYHDSAEVPIQSVASFCANELIS